MLTLPGILSTGDHSRNPENTGVIFPAGFAGGNKRTPNHVPPQKQIWPFIRHGLAAHAFVRTLSLTQILPSPTDMAHGPVPQPGLFSLNLQFAYLPIPQEAENWKDSRRTVFAIPTRFTVISVLTEMSEHPIITI